jgi:hypothetical protein
MENEKKKKKTSLLSIVWTVVEVQGRKCSMSLCLGKWNGEEIWSLSSFIFYSLTLELASTFAKVCSLLILFLLLSFSLKFTSFLPAYGFGLLLGGENTWGFVLGDLQKTKGNISFFMALPITIIWLRHCLSLFASNSIRLWTRILSGCFLPERSWSFIHNDRIVISHDIKL